MENILKIWSGKPNEIGFGDKPGIVVVDFQEGFTKSWENSCQNSIRSI